MDTITICDLALLCRVGVPDTEREKPQRLLLTVEMKTDFTPATQSDDLNRTIDYAAVAQRLVEFTANRTWKLIETLAADLAELVILEFKPEKVAVEVKKFVLPDTQFVSVRVKRKRTAPPSKK